MLPLYERLFEQPFALPKLDLVGIPDFSAGQCPSCRLAAVHAFTPTFRSCRVHELW